MAYVSKKNQSMKRKNGIRFQTIKKSKMSNHMKKVWRGGAGVTLQDHLFCNFGFLFFWNVCHFGVWDFGLLVFFWKRRPLSASTFRKYVTVAQKWGFPYKDPNRGVTQRSQGESREPPVQSWTGGSLLSPGFPAFPLAPLCGPPIRLHITIFTGKQGASRVSPVPFWTGGSMLSPSLLWVAPLLGSLSGS